ncbi:hypothetical protein [Mesoterricola silvestris]|nr:hypothetical protein [Mesoterricola silvestris]
MSDSFLTRIPSLSDAQLRDLLQHPRKYQRRALEAAAAEWRSRGFQVPEGALDEPPAPPRTGFLRDARGPRMDRIRLVTGSILAAGALSALVLHRFAVTTAAPFALEDENSKAYLRQLEMMGGKANLLASQVRQGFASLWQGTTLAYTVFWISVAVAGIFWVVATQTGHGTRD